MPKKFLSPYALIFVTVVVDLIGFGIVIPILPVYSEGFGATPLVIGTLLAAFPLMQFLFTPILGRASDRIGRRPILLVSMLGSALAFLVMGSAQALWMLFLGRIIDGITGGNISTAQAYIADITPKQERAKGVGIIGAGFGVGLVIGPMLGGLAAHFGHRIPFYVAALIALINSVSIFIFLPETCHGEGRGEFRRMSLADYSEVIARCKLRAPMILYVVTVFSMTLVYATFALFLDRRFRLNASGIGYMFGSLGVIGIVANLRLIGPSVKRFGEIPVVRGTLLLMGLALLLLVVLTRPLPFMLALVLYGITNAYNNTVVLAIVSQRAPADLQGGIIGKTQSGAALARVVAPVVAGWLFGHVGVGAPFLMASVVSLIACVISLAIATPTADKA